MSPRGASPTEQIIETVASWPGISTGEGRFGSTTFDVAGREIGHVHRGGPVDIGYPKPIRDLLIAEGLTGDHHVIPASNATTFHVESEADVERAVTLLRISYLYHVSVLQRSSAAESTIEDVDVEAAIEALDLTDGLRSDLDQTIHAG